MITAMVIIGILLVLTAGISFIPYRLGFYADTKRQDVSHEIPDKEQYKKVRERLLAHIRELDARPYEKVTIRAHDGKMLTARYYHQADGAPLDIGFHGYKSHSIRDFCGGSRLSFAMGHNLLLPDQRAHGGSDGYTISFGIVERLDCLDWIRYANERFGDDTKICLYGVSMGAATVLMATELELPSNLRAVIADCPYSSPKAIIRRVACETMGLPFRLFYPFLKLGALLYGHFRFDPTVSAVNAVKKSPVPILVLHGEDDRFVPCDMSREIRDANPEKVTLVTFPEAGHALSCPVDPEGYAAAVLEFLRGHTDLSIPDSL